MKKLLIQFVKFGFVGALSTVIDWGIYFALTRLCHINYIPAKMISFSVAVMNSYLLNRVWTFQIQKNASFKEFIKFIMIALIGLSLNTLIMFIVVDKIKLIDIWGLVIATVIVVFWNFSSSRFWVFKEVK